MTAARGPLLVLAQRGDVPELLPELAPPLSGGAFGEPRIAPLLLRPESVLVALPALGAPPELVEEPLDPIELPLLDELP